MNEPAELLLRSTDATLIDAVRGAVGALHNLRLEIMSDLQAASSSLHRSNVALVLVHLGPGCDASHVDGLLRTITAGRRPVATLVISDHHHGDEALSLLRMGAADYLSRPLDLGRLAYLTDILTLRVRYARRGPTAQPAAGRVRSVGKEDPFLYVPDDAMGRVMEHIQRVAPQETTILLTGETGTGKTRLARLIHEVSPRRDYPFMVVDCGALSPTLIESEMFGHVKGAFTGADRDRAGKFAEVGRGTLLLDEIDSLPLHLQTKLLRAVDARVFVQVGSNKSVPLLARLIAATNRSLDQEVAAGRFRPDLYYRLNVVGIYLPPLRERPSVIAPLVHQCISEFTARNGRAGLTTSAEALQALEEYGWPGNLRELRNVIERAVALCAGDTITVEDLPDRLWVNHSPRQRPWAPAGITPQENNANTLAQTKEEAEMTRISEALQKHRNNRLRAAAELGISRWTLYKKLHKYGLMNPAEKLTTT